MPPLDKPTLEEWRALFDAALDFESIECWKWMLTTDLFGVRDPESGEIGYCCVAGYYSEEEVCALQVHVGTEGLMGYREILNAGPGGDKVGFFMSRRCIEAAFDDPGSLSEPDLDVIKKLGLNFRGRKTWPCFRSYRPGYFPWYCEADEARFLTVALRQAMDVALRFKEDRSLLDTPSEDVVLVRVSCGEGDVITWRDERCRPSPPESGLPAPPPPPLDEVRLQRIRKTAARTKEVLEIDFRTFPVMLDKNKSERPYLPRILFIVSQAMSHVLGYTISKNVNCRPQFLDFILDKFESGKFLPMKIMIVRKDLADLFGPAASALGIELTLADSLENFENAYVSVLKNIADMRRRP